MALSVVNNGASLNAQANLNRTSAALSKSLERLSTGLKINRGADGPAGLVISETQRAQISGLTTAIANTNKATSLVQTAEGALNEINSLLTKVRGLAVDSANSGVNDSSALAANQSEITNALSTIDNIVNTTKFGSNKFLLNGSAGSVATVAGANTSALGQLTAGVGATTQLAQPVKVGGASGGTLTVAYNSSGTQGANQTITLSGGGLAQAVTVAVGTANYGTIASQAQLNAAIQSRLDLVAGANTFSIDSAGVITSNISASAITGAAAVGIVTAGSGSAAGAATTNANVTSGLATGGTGYGAASAAGAGVTLNSFSSTTAGTLTISQAAGGGGSLSASLQVGLTATDTADTAKDKVQAALDAATSIGGGAGKFTVSLTTVGSGRYLSIKSNVLGSGAISIQADSAATTSLTGVSNSAADIGASGNSLLTYINGSSAAVSAGSQSLYNAVGGPAFSFVVGVSGGRAASGTNTVDVNNNSLTFQIGANAGETQKLSIDKVNTTNIGTGVSGLNSATTTSLSLINVTTANGSQDAIKVVDQAISDISTLRGKLGAFQTNTLESNANNLQSTLENTKAAESVIRDTDFASEIANFTRLQTQVQAGSTVLGNANQTTALVAQLLRG